MKAFLPGRHILADMHGIAAGLLNHPALLERVLRAAALEAGAEILFSHFHHFGEAQGVTGVVLLSESHISIHTWPEIGFAALDVFMCGNAEPEKAVRHVLDQLKPDHVEQQVVNRQVRAALTS